MIQINTWFKENWGKENKERNFPWFGRFLTELISYLFGFIFSHPQVLHLQESKWTKWTKWFILYPLCHFTRDKMNKMNKMIHFDPPCNTTNVKMNKMYYFDPPYNSARTRVWVKMKFESKWIHFHSFWSCRQKMQTILFSNSLRVKLFYFQIVWGSNYFIFK